jgi:hypothetical protein
MHECVQFCAQFKRFADATAAWVTQEIPREEFERGSKSFDNASSCPRRLFFRQAHTWAISASAMASSCCVSFHALFDFHDFMGMPQS